VTAETLAFAREYCRRGWRVIPVPAGEKAARLPGWQKLTFGPGDLPQYFDRECNIGIAFGPLGGELVDVDLDCREALELADLYLPKTKAEFGRPSRPRSHRLYVAAGAAYASFGDPASPDTKDMILELRAGAGHQTLFPPSIADGERREWHGQVVAPRVIDAAELTRAVAWLAVGVLVMRHVSEHAARRPKQDLPQILWETDPVLGRRADDWLGTVAPDATLHRRKPRSALNGAELDLAEVVAAIPNDCTWEEWNRIGMAIWGASGGSTQGRDVFEDFSARSPKYNPDKTAERWRNYGRSPPQRLGMGTLVFLAQAHGWQRGSR